MHIRKCKVRSRYVRHFEDMHESSKKTYFVDGVDMIILVVCHSSSLRLLDFISSPNDVLIFFQVIYFGLFLMSFET